jgi:hypothetical protein
MRVHNEPPNKRSSGGITLLFQAARLAAAVAELGPLGRTTRMRNRLISLACWLSAIVITIALSAFASHWGWFPIFALTSIIWAALDSKRVRLWRCRTGISGGPTTIFILLLVLGWPLVFPWYLGMRFKIWARVARLREEYQPWQMSDPTPGPTGLVQPWRGRKL